MRGREGKREKKQFHFCPPLLQYRRALSVPVIKPQPTTPSSHRKYAELEHSFTDYGQRLKVEKIITGHHPTSQRTTVSPKRDVSWWPVGGLWIVMGVGDLQCGIVACSGCRWSVVWYSGL